MKDYTRPRASYWPIFRCQYYPVVVVYLLKNNWYSYQEAAFLLVSDRDRYRWG